MTPNEWPAKEKKSILLKWKHTVCVIFIIIGVLYKIQWTCETQQALYSNPTRILDSLLRSLFSENKHIEIFLWPVWFQAY